MHKGQRKDFIVFLEACPRFCLKFSGFHTQLKLFGLPVEGTFVWWNQVIFFTFDVSGLDPDVESRLSQNMEHRSLIIIERKSLLPYLFRFS